MKNFATAILAAGLISAGFTFPAFGQEEEKPKPEPKQKPKPKYKLDADGIPDAKPEVIIQFMQRRVRRLVNDPPETEKRFKKELMTVLKAAEKILKTNPQDVEIRTEAIGAKIGMLKALNSYGDKSATTTLTKFLKGLKADKAKSIRELAAQELLLLRASKAPTLNNKEREALSKDVLAYIQAGKLQDRFAVGMEIAQLYERSGQKDAASSLYLKLAGLLKKSKDKDIAAQASIVQGFARRVNLVGSTLKVLDGKTVAGKEFDWKKYRGKVVLIDFWATWCAPCRAEMPNLLRLYEKYNDKGFEIIGVSGDRRKEPLTEFIKYAKLPWTNLFHPDPEADHPMAEYYGIVAFPSTILVDRKGKVVATQVRGARLARLVRGLLEDDEAKGGKTNADAKKPKADGK